MKRRFLAIAAGLMALCVMFGASPAFAVDEKAIYTNMALLTANVYVCDSVKHTIVLKGVQTWQEDDVAQDMQKAMEYAEIPITHRALLNKDGALISLQNINESYLDQRAQVLVAKNGYGYKVIWLRIQ